MQHNFIDLLIFLPKLGYFYFSLIRLWMVDSYKYNVPKHTFTFNHLRGIFVLDDMMNE